MTVFALISTVYLIANNWQRYSANPTVLSLEKNYRSWRVPFPAATICLLDRVNVTAATAFVYRSDNKQMNLLLCQIVVGVRFLSVLSFTMGEGHIDDSQGSTSTHQPTLDRVNDFLFVFINGRV